MIYVVRYALISVYTVIAGTAACLVALFDRKGEITLWITRTWIAAILGTCGIRVEVEGIEHIAPDQPQIFMSNHQSVFDIAAIIETLPVSFRFVAKKELTRIPFFGWGLVAAGHIIVDRKDRERAVASLKKGAEQIRTGTNVIVFPEGTRSTDGSLGEFKSGGFHLALEAGVPIVPIRVTGSEKITPKRSLRIESGTMHIRYGEPIETSAFPFEEREKLKDAVREAIGGESAKPPAPTAQAAER